jgi:hypothetical protein
MKIGFVGWRDMAGSVLMGGKLVLARRVLKNKVFNYRKINQSRDLGLMVFCRFFLLSA